ncbi:hypothetical protein FQV30_07815 [Planomicrobium sp. CPCC 101110]|nr:hypothetical protein FQV30_07815 [Planomicrobium sp. CPCC 101110]
MKKIFTVHQQMKICKKYNAKFYEAQKELKVGIALNVKDGVLPINGMRIPPEGDTTGWYIWGGEGFSEDPDFFVPLHLTHIEEWIPGIEKYLGLAPGWRFLIAGDYEDVWYDETLIELEELD